MTELFDLADEPLLDALQSAAFGYFLETFQPAHGLVTDSTRDGSPVSIAVVGFALSCYPTAVERGWMKREDALARSLSALRFFEASDQSGGPEATGYKGFYYHFLHPDTGARMWSSELSMIDSALLVAGAFVARMYFSAESRDERALRELVDALHGRMEWTWALNRSATICQGWKPESGFLNYDWQGYNEALLLYVLALGSPTHALGREHYTAWTATYPWENLYGHDLLYAGPLFVHQFSHAWIDFRDIQDEFMREKRCDYFENSRRATLVQREYARRNPHGFVAYDESCWGLTACDGPGLMVPARTPAKTSTPTAAQAPARTRAQKPARATIESPDPRARYLGNAARSVPYGPDDGTIAGWAALGSLPFTPEISLSAVRHMGRRFPEMITAGRFASSFNPTLAAEDGRAWVSPGHFGLDQGLVVMMIENQRTQSIWRSMRNCPCIAAGLRRAGFRGGWL